MKNLIKAMVLSAALFISAQSFAQLRITLAPPALRTEIVTERPFDNAVWQPGYWSFNATLGSYEWISGKWVSSPFSGAVWVPSHYNFRDGEYHFVPGHWRQ